MESSMRRLLELRRRHRWKLCRGLPDKVLAADKATIARFAHNKFGRGCNVGSLQDLPESEREMVNERIMAKAGSMLETKIDNDKKTHDKKKKRAAAEMGNGVGDGTNS
ncbi:hypothetical protein FOA52_001870 [Chlamydomonas sp. UWO 241]|nr:hypothetical protein FOA52_001870 [Chlamydomonas sp. UWO 241]